MKRPLTPINAAQKCITALNVAGYLSYFDLIQFPSALNQFPSLTNVINSTQSNFINSFAYVKGIGFVSNGTTSYMATLLNPASGGLNYSKNDCHLGVLCRSTVSQNSIDIGAYDGSANGTWLATLYGNGHSFTRLNASTSADHGVVLTDARGYTTAERSNSTQEKIYKDGVLLATTANTSTAIPNFVIWANGVNSNGSLLQPASRVIGIITVGKSGVNNATVVNIFNQYLADIGAPLKTVYFLGDSFMVGQNATNIYTSFAGDISTQMKWDMVNSGVSGQALATGGTQPGFNTTNIPQKTNSYDYKVVVDWGLNDAYNIYTDGSRTLAQFQSAVTAFLTAFTSKGWTLTDLLWVTGWQVSANIYYTQAQLNTLFSALRTILTSNGVQFTQDFTAYPVAADGVHPANDASYQLISNQIYNQLVW